MSHSEEISNFQAISGATEKEAKNWLEKSRWNLEEALSRFFDAGGASNVNSAAIEDAEAKQRRIEKKERLVNRLQDKVREQVELDELVNPSVGIKIKIAGGVAELLPLRGAKIQAQVRDIVADISLEMRFINDTPNAVEALFRLAVDQGAIYHFEAETSDGKKVVADVKNKEDAFNTYDDAIASGHGAFLVEKTKEIRDAFQITLGNMLPNREVIVMVKYAATLETEGDALRLVLPVTRTNLAGTRRVVDLEEDDDQLVEEVMAEVAAGAGAGADAARGKKKEERATTSAEFAKKVPDGLNVNVDVEMSSRGLKIARIESPSHTRDMKASVNKSKANVSFTNAQVAKLMEVLIFLEDASANTCTLEAFDRDGKAASSKAKEVPHAAVVSFCPKIETSQEPAIEAIFLVDRSGSMAGSFMNQAKNALQIFLRSLPLGTKFNIVSFGTSFSALYQQSAAYTEDTMRQAERHVDEMSANMVGTNLLQPMQFVLTAPVDAKCPRQIFLLTDGSVDNTSAVLSLVRNSVGDHQRIFTLGVGSDAGRALVAGIARFGRGKAEFVRSGQRLEAPVMRHIKRALQPALLDLEVEWGSPELGDKFEVVPVSADPHYPPVFDGERITLSTFFKSTVPVESDDKTVVPLKISGRMRDEKFSFTVDLNLKWLKNGSAGHRIAANSAIQLLQRNKGHETHKAEILDLALTYGIASKFTSLVAVEERDGVAATGEMTRVDVNSKQQGDVAGRIAVLPQENLLDLETDVRQVRDLMMDNVDGLMARSEKLDALPQQQSQLLSAGLSFDEGAGAAAGGARDFQKSAKKKSSGGFFSNLFGGGGDKDKKSKKAEQRAASPQLSQAPMMAADFAAPIELSFEEEEAAPSSSDSGYGDDADDAYAAPVTESRSRQKSYEREQAKESASYFSAPPLGAAAPARPASYAMAGPPPPPAAYEPPAPMPQGSYGFAASAAPAAPMARRSSSALSEISAAPRAPAPVSNSAMRPLDRFVRMIRAAGNFNLVDVATASEKTESVLRKAAPDTLASVSDRDSTFSIWATALALVLFTSKFGDSKDEWETVAAKAKRWLTRAIDEAKLSITVDSLLEAAKKVVV